LFAPAKTPREIVDRMNQETLRALQNPEVKAMLAKLGADPKPMRPDEFDAFVKKEIDMNAAFVKAAGIKIN
jgi:tripartite-type tricarboxylate transporter receptor subunit TctC